MRLILTAAAACVLAACQPAAGPNLAAAPAISAPEAVIAAAAAAPRGVPGTFGLVVKRAEMVGPRLFLNSEKDYRDQRNLSIAVEPSALPLLRKAHGPDLRAALLGRDIRVRGVARRVRIGFTSNGRPTGKYYFQTHVTVTSSVQITVVG